MGANTNNKRLRREGLVEFLYFILLCSYLLYLFYVSVSVCRVTGRYSALNLNLPRRVPRQQLYGSVSWFYVFQNIFILLIYIVFIIRYILV